MADMNKNSRIIYKGKSLIDGFSIIAILSGVIARSRNPKTADMMQTSMLREDISPKAAKDNGAYRSVCGNCPAFLICYVKGWSQASQWKCYKKGRIADYDPKTDVLPNKPLRIGEYGNPSSIPIKIWKDLLKIVPGHTGYDHRWKSIHPAWNKIVMASCGSSEDRKAAKRKGYRTYRYLKDGDRIESGEIKCPYTRMNNVTCASCQLCNGKKGASDTRKDIAATQL